MAAQSGATATRGFWIVGGIFLVWNLMGVMAFIMQITMSDEALAALPEAQRALYTDVPIWATAAFAVAVFGGTLGCILLLLKKALAVPVFVASLIGIVIQTSHSLLMTPALEVLGPGSLGMPIAVTAGAIFLVWYASRAKANGVIA